MDTVLIRKYLSAAYNVKEQINILQEKCDLLSEDSLVQGKYGQEYISNPNVSKPVEEEIMLLFDALSKYFVLKEKYANILLERIELIDAALPLSSVDNKILKYRYIDTMRWKEISNKTFYRLKHLNRIHSRAMRKISNYVDNHPLWKDRIETVVTY